MLYQFLISSFIFIVTFLLILFTHKRGNFNRTSLGTSIFNFVLLIICIIALVCTLVFGISWSLEAF